MRRLGRVLSVIWSIFGTIAVGVVAYQLGSQGGYGKGARDIARLMIEMRQGATETPDSWDRGEI